MRTAQVPEIALTTVDVRGTEDRVYAALTVFGNRLRAERLPDDPPIALEERIQRYRTLPPFVGLFTWVGWSPDQQSIVAEGSLQVFHMDDNAHLGQVGLAVLPEYRRQGLGRRLLAHVAREAARLQRRLLMFETTDRIPAGAAFLALVGAERGLDMIINQLDVADLDRDLVARWLSAGQALAGEFELGLWDGPYPDSEIVAIARLLEVMNQAPLGSLEVDDMHFTPDQLRQMEKSAAASGLQRWTFFVRESATGRFAGFTDTFWHADRPAILQQGETGVFPEYRGRGLGRWLKAAMLAKVTDERPSVRFIRTGNATSNAAMLKINQELGFRPYMQSSMWQLETAQAQAWLARAPG